VNYKDSLTVTHLFREQVAHRPEAFAIVSGEERLTYLELDRKSNQLARHLQNQGVGKETLVGVLLNRSEELPVALLGILKAGGAYVPLDPGYPPERISFVIEDSRTPVILSTGHYSEILPATTARILRLDQEATAVAGQIPEPLAPLARGDHLAYVIYTSGSTGTPKGVMVEHRNVHSFFLALDRLIGTDPGVWLAVTSISFDISVLELFWTLTRGYQVLLHSDEGAYSLSDEIVRFGVTHLQLTPSLARMLAADPRSLAALRGLKKLLIGGEALPVSLAASLRSATPAEIYNMYGPTETTIWSTAFPIPAHFESRTHVPIGLPLANTEAYVLGPDLRPLPPGEPGELFLGGAGVVRGYWERARLTAERFLSDPFRPGNRMYRTGDVARFLPDGNLEFLGRTDFQVKIRGFRIELGEIEALLEQYPAIEQAVVVARESKPGDKHLVAYVVGRRQETLTPALLRSFLRSKVPEYMLPSYFVFLERLPVTANGKIDRNALPRPVESNSRPSRSESRPRSEMEGIIAEVWAEALGLGEVGLDDNFFDLGATSLMVPEVQNELQRRLGREVAVLDLFEFHTVSSLANHFSGGSAAPPPTANRVQRRLAVRNHRLSS
jgi:amino acid adenylation domain-containing protein